MNPALRVSAAALLALSACRFEADLTEPATTIITAAELSVPPALAPLTADLRLCAQNADGLDSVTIDLAGTRRIRRGPSQELCLDASWRLLGGAYRVVGSAFGPDGVVETEDSIYAVADNAAPHLSRWQGGSASQGVLPIVWEARDEDNGPLPGALEALLVYQGSYRDSVAIQGAQAHGTYEHTLRSDEPVCARVQDILGARSQELCTPGF